MKFLVLAALGMLAQSETERRVVALYDCVVPRAQQVYATGVGDVEAVSQAFDRCKLRTVQLDSALRQHDATWTFTDTQNLMREYRVDVLELLREKP